MTLVSSRVVALALVAGLAAGLSSVIAGCGTSDAGTGGSPFGVAGAAGAATAGAQSMAGAAGSISAGAGGASAGAPSAGAAGATPAAGAAGMSTAGAGGSAAGAGGGSMTNDITKVVKSAGCGKDPGQAIGSAVKGTIMTMGTKPPDAADSKKGPWAYTREYYVTLPVGYDPSKAYPVLFEGPGCGGNGSNIYALTPEIKATIIRVGLTPPPNDIGHATNPGQGCFDDKEGDDSVDWVFYENLYDKLTANLCIDRNRIFSAGNSSGSWFSNELGCKYAGDATRPVRGVLPNTGGLPSEAQFEPTCTDKPMSGMWVHEIMDQTNGFAGNKFAIARAMKVNKCTNDSYDAAVTAGNLENFPIGGGKPDDTCKKIKGCPALYPLVVCALPGMAHASHDDVVNPGFSTFLKMFEGGAFVTQ